MDSTSKFKAEMIEGKWLGEEGGNLKMTRELNCKDLFSKQMEMRNWKAGVNPVLCSHSAPTPQGLRN